MPGSSSSDSSCETPAEKLRELVAGWIDVVASQGERAIDAVGRFTPGKPWFPPVDVVESEDKVVVRVNLPGVDPAKVGVVLLGNMLTIKADEPAGDPPAGETVHRRERPVGPFSRSIPLPAAVDPEKVAAESKHGVLTITLAKEERVKPRHIPVGVKAAGS
jgi:HSP20 family protein